MRLLTALLTLTALLLGAPAHADTPSCANPQDAARSLLDWLQPDHWDPAAAATCLDLPPDMQADAAQTATQLKKVLDARGLYVPTDDLPLDPDHTDADGLHRVVPIPNWPALALVKKDGRWLYARPLVESTPHLYAETFSGVAGKVQSWIPARFQRRLLGHETWQYVYFALLVAVSLLAGFLAHKVVADQVIRLARRFKVQLSVKVIGSTRRPLTWLATGVVFRLGIADLQLGVRASQTLLFIANTLVSLAMVLILARLVDVGAEVFAVRARLTESRMDDQVIPLASRAAKSGIWILGVVFVVQNMGVDVGSLLAGLGIGGLAVALAAKDTVENLFGSLTIFTDRPFQIGDWVLIGKDVEGVVEEVGFRSTRVRTFYNSVISVPNGKVANSNIDNMGKRRYRRVKTTLGVTYGTHRDQLDAYVKDIREFLRNNPAVWKGTIEVHFANFGPSSLEIMLYYFLDVPDWTAELTERAKCYMEFIRLAEEHGVSFAFPSTSVYVEKMPALPGAAAP